MSTPNEEIYPTYSTIITHNGDEKYVIAKTTNKDTNQVHWSIVSYAVKYHSQIARILEASQKNNEKLEILGGGLLAINREKKRIFTYGQSGGYGPPDLEDVTAILENSPETQGYKLKITITDYIRD